MTTYASLAVLMAPREGGNPAVILLVQMLVIFAIIYFLLIRPQMLVIFAIIYFLLIRPQRKEQQRHQAMLGAVKKGDEVVTAGGVIGTVIHAEPDRLTIRSGENTRLVVERGRIAKVLSQKDGPRESRGGS